MGKKNIDDLFREKFKDFGELPDDKVWKSIEASLDKKKKDRWVIPIWWKLGGAAAVLALLFYAINPFGNNNDTESSITGTENTETQKTDSEDTLKEKEGILKTPNREKEQVVSSDNGDKNEDVKEDVNVEERQPSINQDDGEAVANTLERDPSKNTGNKEVTVTSNNPEDEDYTNKAKKKRLEEISKTEHTEVVISDAIEKDDKDRIDENRNQENGIPNNPILKEKSSNEAVAQIDEKKKDSIDGLKKKSIFEDIKKEEEEVVAQNNGNRWSVGPSIAPVFFDSFGEGSPIHSSFSANAKSGNVNLSYGVAVSYNVSKKLSIRSGVHKVDYGYDTEEVQFSSSPTAATNGQFNNIAYSNNSENLVVRSSLGNNSDLPEAFANSNDVLTSKSPAREGRMVQEFGYLEVPVELNYALVDKKLGVNLIGGVSSLFLTNNSVTLESDGTATEMGEANNINNVNFSTNIGFGINYKVTPKMQLNLEPMFKYQLNTFSNTDGNFQPFSVGVYSGLNFRF